jgi:ferric-dicitrate binding protein FerR (iron transport regulator)
LPDGAEIAVGKSQSGIIGYMGKDPIEKNDDFLSIPSIALAGTSGLTSIKTVPGKELRVRLSDGTRAWMSGNSELSFPDGFTPNERSLALKGETYFEVEKEGNPFKVQVREMGIEVLGTKFTVSARKAQGPVITSLIEGQVKLTAGKQTMLLFPNEEGVWVKNEFSKQGLGPRGKNRIEGKKSGLFIFDNSDIKTMLEEVAENYNYEVEYNGVMPARTRSANFSRNMDINLILKNLSRETGIGLSLHGNKIIVDFPKIN